MLEMPPGEAGSWAGDPPEVTQGELELQAQQLLAEWGAYRDLVPGRECLRCPLVTLSLLMGLFLVQDPKCFVAINYPNGEAVPVKPISQMGNRTQGEVNDLPGAGAGLERWPGPAPSPPSHFKGPFLGCVFPPAVRLKAPPALCQKATPQPGCCAAAREN